MKFANALLVLGTSLQVNPIYDLVQWAIEEERPVIIVDRDPEVLERYEEYDNVYLVCDHITTFLRDAEMAMWQF